MNQGFYEGRPHIGDIVASGQKGLKPATRAFPSRCPATDLPVIAALAAWFDDRVDQGRTISPTDPLLGPSACASPGTEFRSAFLNYTRRVGGGAAS